MRMKDERSAGSAKGFNMTARSLDSLTTVVQVFRGAPAGPNMYHQVVSPFTWLREDVVCHGGAWGVKGVWSGHGPRVLPRHSLPMSGPISITEAFRFASVRRKDHPLTQGWLTGGHLLPKGGVPNPSAIPDGLGGWAFGTVTAYEDPGVSLVTTSPDNWPFYGAECGVGSGNWWLDNPEVSTDSPGWAYSDYENECYYTFYPVISTTPGNQFDCSHVGATVKGGVSSLGPPELLMHIPDDSTIHSASMRVSAVGVERTVTVFEAAYGDLPLATSTTTTNEGAQVVLVGARPGPWGDYSWEPVGASVALPAMEDDVAVVVDATDLVKGMLAHRTTPDYAFFGTILGDMSQYLGAEGDVADKLVGQMTEPTFSYAAGPDEWWVSRFEERRVVWTGMGVGRLVIKFSYPGEFLERSVIYEFWPRRDGHEL